MTAIETQRVRVRIETVTQGEKICFSGTGEVTGSVPKIHLHYTVKGSDGILSEAALSTGLGKVSIDNGSYRLLLDPTRETHCTLPTEAGNMKLTVSTKSTEVTWDGTRGTIRMDYRLLSSGQLLSDFLVTIELRRE